MATMKPKGKKVKGNKFVEADEKYDGKDKSIRGSMADIPGVASKLKAAESKMGYSKKPQVKPQKKTAKPVSGKKGKISY
jgi:hypothetical protein